LGATSWEGRPFACREARDEGCAAHHDAAVRLMVHQLAWITGVSDGCDGLQRTA
jgi:hypothetical protein